MYSAVYVGLGEWSGRVQVDTEVEQIPITL